MNKILKFLKRHPVDETIFAPLYSDLMKMPDDFDPGDPERKRIFSERLRTTRRNAAKSIKSKQLDCNAENLYIGRNSPIVATQSDVANWFGITKATVSNYENYENTNKYGKIPVEYLLSFYDMFEVTPHYLVGYTDRPDGILLMENDDQFMVDENGNYKVGYYPFSHPILTQKKSVDAFNALCYVNANWFTTLCQFLACDDAVLETGFELLEIIVKNSNKFKESTPS